MPRKTGRDVVEPTFVSLFSGCGGLDHGFITEGFKCLGAYDIDAAAVETHRLNFPGHAAQLCDLQSTQPLPGVSPPDVVVAGPPCQGFSTIGQRKYDDPRNALLLTAGTIAVNLRPSMIVIENVAGVVAGKHAEYWHKLRALLAKSGYHTHAFDINCSHFGVPQRRRRQILIGSSTPINFDLEMPTSAAPTVASALIRATSDGARRLGRGSQEYIIASHIAPGQKLCDVRGGGRSVHTWNIPEVFGPTTSVERKILETVMQLRRRLRTRVVGDADPVPVTVLATTLDLDVEGPIASLVSKNYLRRMSDAVDLRHAFNGKFRRVDPSALSPAVDTRFGDPKYFLHPSEQRGFSVSEAAALQGFPGTFKFPSDATTSFRLIGNSVPPPVSKHLARYVRRTLSKAY